MRVLTDLSVAVAVVGVAVVGMTVVEVEAAAVGVLKPGQRDRRGYI
jgi:hypothetical protein